jgi:hypothetical protein
LSTCVRLSAPVQLGFSGNLLLVKTLPLHLGLSDLSQAGISVGLTFDFVELRSAPASVPFGVLLCAQKRAKRSFEPACAMTSNKRLARREPKPAHVVLAAAAEPVLPFEKGLSLIPPATAQSRNRPRGCCTPAAPTLLPASTKSCNCLYLLLCIQNSSGAPHLLVYAARWPGPIAGVCRAAAGKHYWVWNFLLLFVAMTTPEGSTQSKSNR